MEDLTSKIRSDLEKTGFPLELVSSFILVEHGWEVVHSPGYLDSIESKPGTYDVRAKKTSKLTIPGVEPKEKGFGMFLVIECKKTEKPWVGLVSPNTEGDSALDWVKEQPYSSLIDVVKERVSGGIERLKEIHHYYRLPEKVRSYTVAFTDEEKERGRQFFRAISSVVDAVLWERINPQHLLDYTTFVPIILLDGKLFAATIMPNAEISVEPRSHVQVVHHHPTLEKSISRLGTESLPSSVSFLIDVVTAGHFETFLTTLEEERQQVEALLGRAIA